MPSAWACRPRTSEPRRSGSALDRRIETPESGCGVSTKEWFEELPATEAQVTLFLALLELARLQRILLGQSRGFGAVLLKRLA